MQQQRCLIRTILLAFLQAFLPGIYAMCGIFVAEIDVSHCIINLVEIVFILVAACHPFQAGNHLAELTLMHNLSLHDTGVERYFVWGIGAYYMRKSLVCHRISTRFMIELGKQEVETGFRQLASSCLYSILQIRNSFCILMCKHIVACLGVLDFLLSFSCDAVTLHFVKQVFSIVRPIQCNITSRQLCLCNRRDIRLCTI